jgi:beta-lactamase regulating signal transducer with metallopeptidase domain
MSLFVFYLIGLIFSGLITYFIIKMAVQHGVAAANKSKTETKKEKKVNDPIILKPADPELSDNDVNKIQLLIGIVVLIFIVYFLIF